MANESKNTYRQRIARTIIHLRIYIIIICVGLSAFFISVLKDIEIQTRLDDFLPQRHPFVKVQHTLTDIFGGLNQVSLALSVKEGTIFTEQFLEKVIDLTENLYLLEGVNVSRIYSIASRHVKHVVANDEGYFVERLLRLPPSSEAEMQAFRNKVINNPTVYGKMVSQDLKSTVIYVDFESKAKTSYIFDTLIKELKQTYEDDNTTLYIAGRPILEGWLNEYLPRMFGILVISLFIVSVVLYMTFRSKRGVILPLIDSSMATLWGMGTMKLMGLRLDPSTILVPFIILSLGISHSIHTLKRYYEEMRDPKMKSKHAIVSTMAHLFIPGIACVLTDGFGFLSLTLVPLPTIRSMAYASGLGILANFFTSFMFTPCILSFLHRPKILAVKKEETHVWVDRILSKLSIFSLNKRAGTLIVSIFLAVCIGAFFGITKIVIGDNTEGSSYLYPDSPYNKAEAFINRNFGGTNSYYVFVESDSSLLTSGSLKEIDAFEQYLVKKVKKAGSSLSIADAFKAMNMFMHEADPAQFLIPDNDTTISEYWFLYTFNAFPGDFDHLITKDELKANIKFNLKDHTYTTVHETIERTKQFFKDKKKSTLAFHYGGGDIGILYAINGIIRRTIIPNALFISLLIFIYVSFIYRSPLAGVILLLPLILSNLIVFSLFGFFGTSITTETLPLISLSEGLGINYGIYILARFYDEMREKKRTYKNILRYTLITSGKAVFFSGLVVSLGIFVWVFSSILLQSRLGVNLCLSLILNMITSLVMIPVLIWWIKPRFLFPRIKKRFSTKSNNERYAY